MHLDAIECLTINKVEIVLGIRILVDNRFEFPDIVFYICHLVIVELRQDKLGQDRFDILVGMREFLMISNASLYDLMATCGVDELK